MAGHVIQKIQLTEICNVSVDIGLTWIYQASGGTSTCLKYLGYVESTKVFVMEQVRGIYIYKGKCHTFTEVSILKGTKRLLFLLLHPLVSHKFIHHSLLPFIQHFILFTYCLALQPRKNLHFLYDRQPFLLFANCLSLLTFSSHKSFCISSRHLSLDCTLLMFLVAYFQKYFQLPLFDLL